MTHRRRSNSRHENQLGEVQQFQIDAETLDDHTMTQTEKKKKRRKEKTNPSSHSKFKPLLCPKKKKQIESYNGWNESPDEQGENAEDLMQKLRNKQKRYQPIHKVIACT